MKSVNLVGFCCIIVSQWSVQNHKIVDFSIYLLSITEIENNIFIVGK